MLRYAFSLLFLLTFAAVFGQNKKQQLETLTARYDSLTAVLVTERATSARSINELTADQTTGKFNGRYCALECG